MNRPEIVSVGVVWDSERPSLEHIMDVFATVGTSLRLSDVFHSVVDSRWGASTVHNLVGVVTYYGKHYSTFFFHTKLKVSVTFVSTGSFIYSDSVARFNTVIKQIFRYGSISTMPLSRKLDPGGSKSWKSVGEVVINLCYSCTRRQPVPLLIPRTLQRLLSLFRIVMA